MEQSSIQKPNPRARSAGPNLELEPFVHALFDSNDQIELRLIAAKKDTHPRDSRLVKRHWLTPGELLELAPDLARTNEQGVHVYYGVNPRSKKSGVKDAVQTCNAIWADIDNVSVEDAPNYWHSLLPDPSILVSSGRGVHVYWLLDSPADVSTFEKRSDFESLVKAIQSAIGADSTHDVSRLLRLPSFLNVKSPATPCQLYNCNPDRRYSLSDFEKWRPKTESAELQSFREQRFPRSPDMKRVRGLICHLQTEVSDRSRRDFGVVCQLLILGLDPEEIRQLVSSHSKFATDGQPYFETTIRNAASRIGH